MYLRSVSACAMKPTGEGVITKLTDRGVTILFDQSKEIKTLNINFCISRNLLRLVQKREEKVKTIAITLKSDKT